MKILIVEDDKKVGAFLVRELEAVAYSTTWEQSCSAATTALSDSPHDAIILDIGLPDGDGLTLLRQWRSLGFNEPVLILSARDAVQDRVDGLNLGADDYLAKPFSFEELLARLRSLFRRQGDQKTTVFDHRGIRFDLVTRRVQRDGVTVEMTTREYGRAARVRPSTAQAICTLPWATDFGIKSPRDTRREPIGVKACSSCPRIPWVCFMSPFPMPQAGSHPMFGKN